MFPTTRCQIACNIMPPRSFFSLFCSITALEYLRVQRVLYIGGIKFYISGALLPRTYTHL